MRKTLIVFLAIISLSIMIINSNSYANTTTLTGIQAGNIYKYGKHVYYTHPKSGDIYSYDTNKKKVTKVFENKGQGSGYSSLIVLDKFIYTIYNEISGGAHVKSLHRITKYGETDLQLAGTVWDNFTMVKDKLYYNKTKTDVNGKMKKGMFMMIGLDGGDLLPADDITVKRSKSSAIALYANKSSSVSKKTGKLKYTLTKGGKQLKQGKKVIYTASKSKPINSVYAHKDAVILACGGSKTLIYMDKNGKKKKTLSK